MSILQALAGHYERLSSRKEAPPFGFSYEGISYALELAPDGTPVNVRLLETSGKKPLPLRLQVPRPVGRANNIAANFLWDKTDYVFGLKRDRETKKPVLAERGQHAAFKALHEELLAESDDEGLVALRAFLSTWHPDHYLELHHAVDMLESNVVFRLAGEQLFLHERPAAQAIWSAYLGQQQAGHGWCLVTGERAPVQRIHPKVKGVWGAHTAGAAIISFNLDAFDSYGKQQGENAPVSERAAFAYTTALNTLLARGSRRRMAIGDTTTVFWAEASGDETAEAAEDLFSMLVDPPTDEGEAAAVRDKLDNFARGRPLPEIEPDVHADTRFSVLGLAPNEARLSVRFWHQDEIGTFARRIREHWQDLRLEPTPWRTVPSARRLLYETAVQRKAENVPPTLGGPLMRAILTGARYPRSLLAAIIMRMRAADDTVTGRVIGCRAAIAKACIVRAERLVNPIEHKEDYLVSLDRNSQSIAYNLGRLFAAYAYAERSVAERNATIRDKYMGAASATPRRVFPILMRGYVHNLASLTKGDKVGLRVRVDKAVGEIVARIPGDSKLPMALSLEDQARFFVGYYHQEQAFYTSSKTGQDAATESTVQE